MVVIRSWSGGVLHDILSSSSLCDDIKDTKDAKEYGSNGGEREEFDEFASSSSSDDYDDDFTDEESQHSQGSHFESKVALYFGKKYTHNYNDESVPDEYPNAKEKSQSLNDNEPQEATKLKNSFDANVRYKEWLRKIQKTTKKKEQYEHNICSLLDERLKKRRNRLARKALRRRKIRFDCDTSASENGRVERKKEDLAPKQDDKGYENYVHRSQRRKNMLEYRKFLSDIVTRRERESELKHQAQEEADRKRRNVTRLIMNEIREKKSTRTANEDINASYSPTCHNYHDEENKPSIPRSTYSTEVLKQRCIQECYKIAESRRQQDEHKRKLKLRLDKRAKILRQQYQAKLKKEKLWERSETKSQLDNIELENDVKGHANLEEITLSPSRVKALADRLSKKRNAKSEIECGKYDFDKWKRDHQVKPGQKIFCMTGWYPSIREDLIHRGWFFNTDRDSYYFDLKFTLAASDIDFNSLTQNQIVNHFRSSACLTTKVGLLHTLRNSVHSATYNNDSNDFFPRSYDFSKPTDVDSFFDDYHCVQAESILGELLMRWETNQSFQINVGVLKVINSIIRKHNFAADEDFIESVGAVHDQCFTMLQSVIVRNAQEWIYRKVHEQDLDEDHNPVVKMKSLFVDKVERVDEKQPISKYSRKTLHSLSKLDFFTEEHVSFIESTLKQYCKLSQLQSSINGSNNVWILKPSGKSRGRGISVESSLQGILKHIETASDSRNRLNQWVVQKYVENPLIIAKRKFDIRQWILVTNWNPITIWYYNDCYVRFAVDEYDDPEERMDTKLKEEWSSNRFRHLVNNSVGKHNENFSRGFVVEETNEVVNGYMWSLETFKKWLKKKTGDDIWQNSLCPKMKEIVIDCLLCAQENMITTERKVCWEVYGFDIMIDQNFNPWLIEVNSSPACDYSTEVTESFVKKALPDTLKVILDTDLHQNLEDINVGGWQCVYNGMTIPKVTVGLGVDLSLKGSQVSIKRHRKEKGKSIPRKQMMEPAQDPLFDDSDLSDYEQKEVKNVINHQDSNKENVHLNGIGINRKAKVALKLTNFNRKAKKNLEKMIAVPLNTVTIDF